MVAFHENVATEHYWHLFLTDCFWLQKLSKAEIQLSWHQGGYFQTFYYIFTILVQYKVHFASVKILAIWSQHSQMPKIPSSRNISMLTRTNWKLESQIWFYCETPFNHFLSVAFEFMNFIWFLDSCPSLNWKKFSISFITLSPGSAKPLVHKYQKITT